MSKSHSKVLWLEGMALDPHHFQQSDRYQAHQIQSRIRAISRNHWGILSLAVDDDRLSNGDLTVTECSGVLPGGLYFNLPEDGVLPAPRNVADAFDPSAASLDVHLCLPVLRNGANLQPKGSQSSHQARYLSDVVAVSDENTGLEERNVEVGRPNFQIRFGTEQLEGFSSIHLATVVRSQGGFFTRDDRFIPTSLALSASTRLMSLASRALELALAKSAALDDRRLATASQRQLTPSDITAMGLLSAVNTYIPILRNHLSGVGCHPEALFHTLLQLAGQLSAYSSDPSFHPREFPVYDHSSMSVCFNRLSEMLASVLGGAQPSRSYRQLVMTTVRENLFEVEISADETERADFILSAKSTGIPEGRMVSEFPAMIRIASPEMIDGVLRSYTRALQIQHTTRLPVGMPEDPTATYFKIERSGPFWEGICESHKMAVFVPADFGDTELKMAAIMRG